MADSATPDSVRPDQLNLEFSSGRTDTYNGVSRLTLAENEYIIHQGEGAIIVPHGNVTKVTAGEDVEVARE